jgi:uncharacterized protein
LDERNLLIKRAFIYLTFVYGFVLIGWFFAMILPSPFNKTMYSILTILFSLFPFLSTLLTRRITKDKSPWMMKPNFRRNKNIYFVSAFIPGILIFMGAVLFFFIFPGHLDVSMGGLAETYGKYGFPSIQFHTIGAVIKLGIVLILISPFMVPAVVAALGEEIGWRGYLLPILLKLMDKRKAILLNGVLWGLCHAPIIYFGFNYGLDYRFAPYPGIAMMILVCVVLGVWLSYVTITSNSVIPASILHGAVNVIGEFPALVAIPGVSPLLGPNPTGIIGMMGLLIGSVILLRMLSKSKSSIRNGRTIESEMKMNG